MQNSLRPHLQCCARVISHHDRLFAQNTVEPIVLDAKECDLEAIAHLHGRAFARGWSDGEFRNPHQ